MPNQAPPQGHSPYDLQVPLTMLGLLGQAYAQPAVLCISSRLGGNALLQFLAAALDGIAVDDAGHVTPTSMCFLVMMGYRWFSIREHAALCQVNNLSATYHPHGMHDTVVAAEVAGTPAGTSKPAHFLITLDHVEYLPPSLVGAQAAMATEAFCWATDPRRLLGKMNDLKVVSIVHGLIYLEAYCRLYGIYN